MVWVSSQCFARVNNYVRATIGNITMLIVAIHVELYHCCTDFNFFFYNTKYFLTHTMVYIQKNLTLRYTAQTLTNYEIVKTQFQLYVSHT